MLLQVQRKQSFKLWHAILVLFRARQVLDPHSEVGDCRVAQVKRLSLSPDAKLLRVYVNDEEEYYGEIKRENHSS